MKVFESHQKLSNVLDHRQCQVTSFRPSGYAATKKARRPNVECRYIHPVCHNYRNPWLSGAKFSQYAVYLHKNFWSEAQDNAAWSATRIVHHYVLPLLCNVSLNMTSVWTWPACYWYGSQTVAHPSACVSRRKADTLNTNLAS